MAKSTISSKNQYRIFNKTVKNRIFFKRNYKNDRIKLNHEWSKLFTALRMKFKFKKNK